jgi:hypothetical protein
MKPLFDPVAWMIGISLLGGSSVMLLVGLLFTRKYLAAVGVSAGVFIVGLAACLLVDFTLQHPAIEEFFRAGTHKRSAMRTFLPWSLGFLAGILSMGGLLQGIKNRRKERLRRQNPDVHTMLYPGKVETPSPSIERTSPGKPG